MAWGFPNYQWRRVQSILERQSGHNCSSSSLFFSQLLCIWTLQECECRFSLSNSDAYIISSIAWYQFVDPFYVLQLLHLILGENRRGNMSSDVCVHFVGGGLAGITAASATYPLDLVRTRLAAQVLAAYLGWFFFFWSCEDISCRE